MLFLESSLFPGSLISFGADPSVVSLVPEFEFWYQLNMLFCTGKQYLYTSPSKFRKK